MACRWRTCRSCRPQCPLRWRVLLAGRWHRPKAMLRSSVSFSSLPPRRLVVASLCSALQAQGHVDVLDLRAREELLDRFLASHARLLVAAERHADVMRARAVDPDIARLDARSH